MKPIRDSIVFVTGAGRGVGRALAAAFAGHRARVAAQEITPVNLIETMGQIESAGGVGIDLIGDMSKKMQVQGMIETVRESLGEIDIFINHASVAPADDLLGMDEWDWDRTMGVNLKGFFLALQSVGRLMGHRKQGLIVNMVVPPTRFIAAQRHPAYEVSAAGVRELTCQAGREFGKLGVHVFGVEVARHPVDPPAASLGAGSTNQEIEASVITWWQRDPDKVASAVLDLCTRATQITAGQVVVLDKEGLIE